MKRISERTRIAKRLSFLSLLLLVFACSLSAQTLPTPVAYWFLDEATGLAAPDAVAANDLTLTGPAQWAPDSGFVDGALALGGNGAYATRGDALLGPGIPGKLGATTRDFTLSAWIFPDSLTDRNPILVKQGAPERGLMWSAGTSDGTGRLTVEVYKSNNATTGKTELTSSVPLSVGVWQHVAVTYRFVADGTSVLRLYIDGNQVAETTSAVGPVRGNDRALDLGQYTWNSYARFFNGRIDEVQIFDAALTAAQVEDLIDEANLQATNVPPQAVLSATPQNGDAPLMVSFDAGASSDPDGSIVAYDWDFGDGIGSTEVAPVHDYVSPGVYTATLQVTDNLGKTGSTEQMIRATDPSSTPPVARFSARWNGITVTLDATASSDADGSIVSYQWNLGDGAAKSGPTIQHSYAQLGTYNVSLTVIDDSGKLDTRTQAVTFSAPELKVFEINRLVTKSDRGFPWDQPPAPAANGNWLTPINYAEGTLQMRAEIRGQPVAQAMKLQFCMWQYSLTLETCSSMRDVPGTPGTVVTWSSSIPTMYKKDGNPLDWANPRQRYALSIKNSAGLPVSDFSGWNWYGENPDAWYPLDIRYTVVAVPPGKTFGGWTADVLNAAPGYISDVTAPTIGPVNVSAGQTSAVLTWTTSEPATATLVYGPSASYGTGEATSSTLSTTHSVTLSSLSPGSTYHYRIDAVDATGNTRATGDLTFATQPAAPPAAAIVSDDFSQGSLDTAVWTFVNPLGDAALSLNGAQASISVPGGTAHDIWTAGNFAPRIMQAAPNANFEVEIKLDSPVTQRFQIQGLVVQESPSRFLRFDVHHDGTQVRVFAATLVDGAASVRHNVATALSGSPLYLRLARQGNLWTPRYSTDGTAWQTLGSFSHTMNVAAIGVFAANAANSGSPVPAHMLVVDHFFDTAAPIDPEPGAPVITTQPADRIVSAGQTATFSVVASGDAPLAYQWSRNGLPIAGANGASYSIPSVTTADNGALFVVTVSNAAGSVASRAARLDVTSAGAPVIDVWYGPEQPFGALGAPQWAINVLGNVSDPDGLGAVTYSLNGGPAQALSVGPFRRLEAPGDFNVEIPFASLIPGANLIEIRAADSGGNQSVRTVTVQHSPGNVWPLDYSIDWAATGNLQDVAQIVDGEWGLVGSALRPIQRGYDRLVAIGDLAWTDYEVTVPVTLHGFDAKGFERPNFKPALGVMLKWPGHSNWTGSQPAWGYYPAGGGAWYEFEQNGSGSLYVTDFENFDVLDPLARTLSTGVAYIWKVRVESLTGGTTRYSAKVWRATDPEPAGWEIIATDANDVEGGSLLLVAHYVDASFGNVTISPITSDPNEPPPPPVLHHGMLDGVGASWQTVTLPYNYTNPVVVASVRYPNASARPVVTRVRNAVGNRFELSVQNPSGQSLAGTYSVNYTVVEAGVYTQAQHGIKMEAVKFTSNNTNSKGSWWQQEARNYINSYSAPVVLGQVMSANDPRWSSFWARGDTKDDAPSPTKLSASKHVGEDTVKTRANELIGYLVIESGTGMTDGVAYQAGVSTAAVQGVGNSPPFAVPYQLATQASTAVVSSAGMKFSDGGWPVLFGADPLANGALALAIDEDQIADTERTHGSEQVAFLVLGGADGPSAPTVTPPPDIAAEATGTLTSVALGSGSSSDGSPVTNDAPSGGFPLGTTLVTWSATNAEGLTGTATQRVTVSDTTAPQVTAPPNIVTNATGTLTPVNLGQAAATDLFEPVTLVNDAPSSGFPVGTTLVTWTATDANGNSSSGTQSVTVVADGTGGGIVSDTFNRSTLGTGVWTFVNPLGDATLSLNGAQAGIAVPGATAHDIWTAGNFAPRLMQAAPNADFEVEIKFDSPVTQRFQIQGLVVEESATRFVRFDVHHDGSQVRVFAATLVDGTPTIRHNVATSLAGSPLHLRLARQGSLWTPKYSTDGTNWQTLTGFSHSMNVSAIGVFAGNSGSPVPANTALVDYFVSTADSIEPRPPIAVDDTASVVRGDTVVIDVLANDSDPDGDLDPGTVVIQSLPASGTLSDDGTGRLTYIHDGSATTTDSFSYTVADALGTVSNVAEVSLTITAAPATASVFHHGTLSAIDDTWRTVTLPRSYTNPVVIAAVQYDAPPAFPAIARVRNAIGNSFEVRVQNPGNEPLDATYTIHYTVVEAGVYTLAEHGIKMEAARFSSNQTSGSGNWSAGNTRAYAQSYTNPVVVGQVMSENDPLWSVFWARGGTIKTPPTSSTLVVSKHVGEDFEKTRANETIGYLVIEAGSGVAADTRYTAGLSARTVAGVEGIPPYAVPYPAGIAPTTAVLSASAMQGGDGGWPILFGLAPLSAGALDLAFQEDQLADLETTHTTEQVAYLLLE
ncbi:PKD domain-containing protein [Thiocapsa bogorovii]|uniref:PKD domain-containing protein n=1 Tax=Thiocapsa bogorovii TaxID=521689 RepID=UPI001E592C70|nr:PKD domain-containing protein [Thiocapsa bogorovii]UHD17109.1 PKD domain-containing protein [Thiocapsa bogorovii]